MSWGHESTAPSEVTLKKLQEMCKEYREKKEEKKKLEDEAGKLHKEAAGIQAKILQYMEEYGMKSVTGDFGQITRRRNYSVKQPNTPEKREQFFDYLKSQGIFDEMISINSRTLASYVRQEIEAKKEEGDLGFVPPGIDTPEVVETISLKKS